MEHQKEKVPNLRFKGFTNDWEERKLGEHAKYRRGSFPQPYGNKEWYDGEGAMPFVQVVDVTNNLTLVENTKQKISKLAQSKSVFVPKGTVVVTLQGSIGRVAITQYDSFVDRTLLIFEDYEKETDERFWAYTIQKKFEIEKLKAPGGTIKTITKEALSSFDVHLPQFKEQAKIGSFFKKIDDTIALHQRKLDLLNQLKKGMLQKMFADKDSKQPILRFKGFHDDWEQRRLGEVAEIKTGSRNHQDSVDNGKYPFFIRSEKVERLNEYDFDTKAILVPGDGRIGEIFHYYDGKFALHQRVYKVDNFKEVNPLYLLNLFKYKFKKHALRLNAQGTVPSLRLPMFTNWNILIPNLNEQQKIGLFFQQLDSLITLQQRKQNHLKLLKKSLLQQMFI